MKIEAATRLRQHSIDAVTYEQYSQVIASLDSRNLVAFNFSMPAVLKGLKEDIGELVDHMKSIGVGIETVVEAFKEKSIFKLLKGVGFSLWKLLHAVKSVISLPGAALFHALEDLADAFGNSKLLLSMKPAERLAKFQEILKIHPILAKVSGVVVAGLLIWMFLNQSYSGHIDKDLDLVDDIVTALKGDFDLVKLFASADGVYSIAVLLFGLATGGMGITAYGFAHVQKLMKFLNEGHYSLLLALFYTAAKKLHLHVDNALAPKELKACFESIAGRTQDWLSRLPHEDKHAYLKKYKGSKFKDQTKIIHPQEIQNAGCNPKRIVKEKP